MEMQPCGVVGPPDSSTTWHTTGWRVDSDAEVKARMSQSGVEVADGEIEMHGLGVPSGKSTRGSTSPSLL